VTEGTDPRSAAGSEPRKLADLYGSFTDEARVDAAGLEALRDELARIHGLNDKPMLPALFAHLARLWQLDIEPDQHDATHYGARLEQGRLGLPDRDYYLKPDARLMIRKAHREHIVKLLSLAGEPAAEASADGNHRAGRPRSRACGGRELRTAIRS
jgi:putative endopeptidase